MKKTCNVRDAEWASWSDCPLFIRCQQLFVKGRKCWKYDRECGNSVECLAWGYECDFRYADY
jgi:hypothetical protein